MHKAVSLEGWLQLHVVWPLCFLKCIHDGILRTAVTMNARLKGEMFCLLGTSGFLSLQPQVIMHRSLCSPLSVLYDVRSLESAPVSRELTGEWKSVLRGGQWLSADVL